MTETSKSKTFEKQYYDQADLRTNAVRFTRGLIANFENGEITPDSGYVYGNGRLHAETFMLAGNGPTAHAVFLINDDGDVDTGYIEYTESTSAIVALPDWIIEDLYAALRDV